MHAAERLERLVAHLAQRCVKSALFFNRLKKRRRAARRPLAIRRKNRNCVVFRKDFAFAAFKRGVTFEFYVAVFRKNNLFGKTVFGKKSRGVIKCACRHAQVRFAQSARLYIKRFWENIHSLSSFYRKAYPVIEKYISEKVSAQCFFCKKHYT